MGKRKKNVYEEKTGLLGRGDDYHIYHMKKSDYIASFGLGFFLGGIIAFAFFCKFFYSNFRRDTLWNGNAAIL